MTRLLFILVILFLTKNGFGQQENQFTQFGYTPFYYNPAYAGHNDYISISGRHRNQWSGITGAPSSQNIMANFPKILNAIGFGINLTKSTIGIQEKNEISGSYAYSLKIKNATISLGLQLSYRQFINDFTRTDLLPIDGFENDSAIERIRYSNNIFNVGSGLFLNHNRFYLGVSVPRLVEGDLDFEQDGLLSVESRHLYGIFGLNFTMNSSWVLNQHMLFKLAENAPFDLDFQSIFIYQEQVHLGSTIRTGGSQNSVLESIGMLIGFNFNKNIFASMSYDFNTTELRQFENGSFEILLRYNLIKSNLPNHIQNPRYY